MGDQVLSVLGGGTQGTNHREGQYVGYTHHIWLL